MDGCHDVGDLTYNIYQAQQFAKEVSVGPEVVVFQIGVQIVQQELFLLSLLHF